MTTTAAAAGKERPKTRLTEMPLEQEEPSSIVVVKPNTTSNNNIEEADTTETTEDVDASEATLEVSFHQLSTEDESEGEEHHHQEQPVATSIPTSITTLIPTLDYHSIPSFDNFCNLVDDYHYVLVPRDWSVLVADIEGSTALIEAGRYRDVNTVGASCIAAVRNALSGATRNTTAHKRHVLGFNEDFPYVFGGDGASMVVAPHQHEAAAVALLALQRLVHQNYDMHLRVGSVDVATLEDQQVCVEVARYEIADGMCTALFRGGGLALADTLVKAGQGQLLGALSAWNDGGNLSSTDDDENMEERDGNAEAASPAAATQKKTGAENKRTPTTAHANLDGLSCRWNKIPSRHGCVLSLLVMHNDDVYSNKFTSRRRTETNTDASTPDNDDSLTSFKDSYDDEQGGKRPSNSEIYKQVLLKLEEILDPESMDKANPVNPELATYKSASEMVEDENRMHASRKWSPRFWGNRAVEIVLCHVIFKLKQLQHAVIDAPAYTQAMRTHADHRKFDDMVRMVLDCTPAQADAIESFLKDLHRNGKQVFYGLQRSQHTLMTCLLADTNDGNHVHFVDGDLGGYALAAKDLKLQLGNYAMAKRGLKVRLSLKKQNSEKYRTAAAAKMEKRQLRRTITH